jgi:hypothetical protein
MREVRQMCKCAVTAEVIVIIEVVLEISQ